MRVVYNFDEGMWVYGVTCSEKLTILKKWRGRDL
jgi:hypothetical protein